MCECVSACERVSVCACARACAWVGGCACVRACVRACEDTSEFERGGDGEAWCGYAYLVK